MCWMERYAQTPILCQRKNECKAGLYKRVGSNTCSIALVFCREFWYHVHLTGSPHWVLIIICLPLSPLWVPTWLGQFRGCDDRNQCSQRRPFIHTVTNHVVIQFCSAGTFRVCFSYMGWSPGAGHGPSSSASDKLILRRCGAFGSPGPQMVLPHLLIVLLVYPLSQINVRHFLYWATLL
jgi:hypothetical protein